MFERACMVACVMFVWMCNVYLSCGRVLTFGFLVQGHVPSVCMSHALRRLLITCSIRTCERGPFGCGRVLNTTRLQHWNE